VYGIRAYWHVYGEMVEMFFSFYSNFLSLIEIYFPMSPIFLFIFEYCTAIFTCFFVGSSKSGAKIVFQTKSRIVFCKKDLHIQKKILDRKKRDPHE
jgi:hypothetical protein